MENVNLAALQYLLKNSIFVNIELLHSSCEYVLWFVVNQLFDVPVLFGTVYIPPVNSIYSSIDIFDVIEDDLITFITEKDYKVCLIGDFNAHTGTKPDYIVLDEYICNSMQLDNIPSHDININNLDKFGININRASLDKSVDNYGNRLLQLCKSLELFIANGRLGKDSGIGALTCKETTVVDYCILSPELFTHVCEFKILPFDAMISDVHNGVHIEFMSTNKPNVGIQVNNVNKNGSVTVKPKWDNEKYQSFVDNLNDTEIDNICEKLNVLEVENIDKSVINNLVEDCNIIIRDASGLFNIICNNSVSGSRRKNKPNKPWFNRECFVKRKEYHRAKNYNWRVKTVESKNSMKLRGLNQNDPKSYWSLINRSCNKNMKENVVNKVSLDCFLEHFKKLNTVVPNENDDFTDEIDTSNVTELNTELNSVITVEELAKNVKTRLCVQYKQSWVDIIFNSPKCLNYRIFKKEHKFESYLNALPFDLRKALCNFRCVNHKLPIERGRFWNINREDGKCDICDCDSLGDEFHYMFVCPFFRNEHRNLLPYDTYVKPNIEKFCTLFNTDDYQICSKLALFCKIVLAITN
ncbi:unnamed protein product [Mytilus coruscus]|uniref:Endonuclease/exonuclease/phosphatase domain-containing protein n=1 Tax=Mytilus coruscus TaxID=42192 RepID=A0A6J8BM42_MYTCO|nr:unnamed protein product [Mytilus coruscus]